MTESSDLSTVTRIGTCEQTQRLSLAQKRALVIAALVALSAALPTLCVCYGQRALALLSDTDALRTWTEAHAPYGQLAFVAANAAQVVFAFLPGEPLELAAGYVFGFWQGTALCLAASALGTLVIMACVRQWGTRIAGLFFSPEKITSVSCLRDSRRFELLLFVIFLIPGTPKDLLTYVAGLGSSPIWRIVLLTTVGRIPSIVTSTLTASAFGDGSYRLAITVIAITIALVGAGALAYSRLRDAEIRANAGG